MEKNEVSQSEDEFEDLQSRRFEGSYSLSADVSESESSTSSACTFSSRNQLASVSTTSSPVYLAPNSHCLPPPPIMLPVVGDRHVIISPEKPDRSKIEQPELSVKLTRFPANAILMHSYGLSAQPRKDHIYMTYLCKRPQIINHEFILALERTVKYVGHSAKGSIKLGEAELMKERFAKLLLGEDMSGGGKGVSTAQAISNAITNLAASVFGELWKLEPLSPQKKSMWRREMEWLLYVSYSIVELIPSVQEFPGGGTFEVMVTQQRSDLYVNLPALKKLDVMLINILDGFDDNEFYYVDRGIVVTDGDHAEAYPGSTSSQRPSTALEEKWWLPFPKVPSKGLSEGSRKLLQHCKECTQQIFKAAVGINSSVLSDMEVPRTYLEGLPKSEKACLGEVLYHFITADQFSPDCLLDFLDLSSEYSTLEIVNRIESSVHFWRLKSQKKKPNRSKTGLLWGSTVKGLVDDTEKSKTYAHRADALLKNLKLHFPGLPQTVLDMNKIQYNKDIGQSILESYSRVMESLAFNLVARIDDLLYVDDATKQRVKAESILLHNHRGITGSHDPHNQVSPMPFIEPSSSSSSQTGSPCRFLMSGSQRPRRSRHARSQRGF